ncbi:MAG TPA: glycosyltransferase family 39 protein, partial [Polyangia bacterium]
MLNRRSRSGSFALHACTLVVALVGLACLGSTRRSLSGTFDESNHLAAGLEWWQFGTYTLWTENPPLARLAIAALPYFHGVRLPAREQWEPKTHDWDRSWEVGLDLLYAGAGFEQNLAWARWGTLPFFLIALASAWGLAQGRRRPLSGLVAVALTSTLPAFIAHGALATTDMAFVGMFLLATLALWRWFEGPSKSRALALGASVGLALLTKFSLLVFFPITVLAFLV